MKLTQMVDHLASIAAKYRKHAPGLVDLNKHMHDYKGEALTQEQVDALLSNFINFVAATWGVDYALYARDFDGIAKNGLTPLEILAPVEETSGIVGADGLPVDPSTGKIVLSSP